MGSSESKPKQATENQPDKGKDNAETKPISFSNTADRVEQTEESVARPKYRRSNLLGEGTSGKVYECMDPATNQHYAMKVVTLVSKTKAEAMREIDNLKRQIGLLKKLNHPNIVKYYSFDVSEDRQSVEIVLEKVTPGNLRDLVKGKPLDEMQASKMCKQILQALKYLHGEGIIHRDLKGANILINEQGIPKISDFGTARFVQNKAVEDGIAAKCRSLKGTPYWMAPEVLKRTGHTYSADIWSLGCTLIEMLTGLPPWVTISNRFEEIINYIASGIQPPFPPKISKICEKFLNCCLDTNPTKRLSASQLLNHPFIRDANHEDSIEQIDINLLEPYRPVKLQHSKNLRRQQQPPPETEQNEPLYRLDHRDNKAPQSAKPTQNQIQEKTSRRKVSKMAKQKRGTKQTESLGLIDYIETKASKKEKEELQEEKRRKDAQRRQKAKQWEEELKREAQRLSGIK